MRFFFFVFLSILFIKNKGLNSFLDEGLWLEFFYIAFAQLASLTNRMRCFHMKI